MFFLTSKLLWFVAAPTTLLMAGALIGAWLVPRRAGFPRALALACAGALLVVSVAPVGALLIEPLEDRFPPPEADMPPPYGIVILGGAIDDEASAARGQTILDEGASRLTEAAILARRYPAARLVYTGGSAALWDPHSTEALEGRKLLVALGVDAARIAIEDKSRNTDENARFTAALVHPQADQVWLVVTSAYHMPRAMALFRKAGFSARAFPVDYRTLGDARDWRLNLDPPRGLRLFDLAVHEWIGLIAYRASGRIDDWFPRP
ncbi:MAG: YdcF family protein [Roseiarcus sp.]